ncbi:hypothetical protein CQW23_32072 [Capsicum baccatum]|uniref:Copia protein n=1 Tax=Capsicum baccatum TaxID=33114 RepID=A0A2G2V5S4_CAPBA|nr:hypothetical protein CQW23_32072 [Capsicum baccatum]
MEDCKSTATPMNQNEKFCKEDGAGKVDEGLYRRLIGCLMYLTATRPDIVYGFWFWNILLVFKETRCRGSINSRSRIHCSCFSCESSPLDSEAAADLYMEQKKSTEILADNEAAISIANNPVSHGKTKHFKIKLYFLREVQKNGDINMVHCRTDFQNADILTKSLPRARFEFLRERLGVTALESRRSVKISASRAAD